MPLKKIRQEHEKRKRMVKIEVLFFCFIFEWLLILFSGLIILFFFFVHILVFYIFAGGETLQYWNNLFGKQRELKMANRF